MDHSLTIRGFALKTFLDNKNVECSLQKSSNIDECIWLGCNEPAPRYLIPNVGWKDVELPPETVSNTRMELSRQQVADLLPYLQKFVDTGEI